MTDASATVSGTVNPQGVSVNVSFEYGATTAYGQSTATQTLAPDNSSDTFTGPLTGLAGRHAARKVKKTHRTVVIGRTAITLTAEQSRTIRVSLGHTGKALLSSRHTLKAKLTTTQTLANRQHQAINTQTVTFHAKAKRHKRH